MRTIHKYKLDTFVFYPDERSTFNMPSVRKYLTINMQDGMPCLWVEVEDESEYTPVEITVVGTGNPIPNEFNNYIGTVQDGTMVWHYFTR